MCHGEHDGKRIWYSLELIQILEAKLAAAEAEKLRVESVLVGAAQELERKLAAAEKRVKELEGLRHAALELAQYASYAEIVGRVSLNRDQIREWSDKIFKLNLAIGEAMPKKDGAVYCTDPDHCTYADCPTAFCDRDKAIPRNG